MSSEPERNGHLIENLLVFGRRDEESRLQVTGSRKLRRMKGLVKCFVTGFESNPERTRRRKKDNLIDQGLEVETYMS